MDQEYAGYCSAEITLFWTMKDSAAEQLVFAVTELIPKNQMASSPLGGGKTPYSFSTLSKHLGTDICGRRFFCGVEEALDCYQRGDWSTLPDAPDSLRMREGLKREPKNGFALVVPRGHVVLGHEASNLSQVLPNRPTTLRACAHMSAEEEPTYSFSQGEKTKIENFVRRCIGIDLKTYGEFFGASVLCMQNPVLWGIKSFGADESGLLYLLLLPRDGMTVEGMHYMIQARHSFGPMEAQLGEIQSEIITFPWPTGNAEPELYLWDRHGTLLTYQPLSFFEGGSFRITFETRELPNGISIPVFTNTSEKRRSKQKTVMEQYEEKRLFQRLEERREFFYFRAGEMAKARDVIGMLLAYARDITICDMYLDAEGLEQTVCGWVNCQTLTLFVSKNQVKLPDVKRGQPNRVSLEESARAMTESGKCQYAAVYTVGGGTHDLGIIHDRFMILDEQVYCLGSSLNGFAQRDTMLFRSPNPATFMERVKEWKGEPKNLLGEWGEANG